MITSCTYFELTRNKRSLVYVLSYLTAPLGSSRGAEKLEQRRVCVVLRISKQ